MPVSRYACLTHPVLTPKIRGQMRSKSWVGLALEASMAVHAPPNASRDSGALPVMASVLGLAPHLPTPVLPESLLGEDDSGVSSANPHDGGDRGDGGRGGRPMAPAPNLVALS
jgi:hypothetical protein